MAVLADPLLQKLLLLRPDAEGSARISNWLLACLDDVTSGDAEPELLLDMLDVVREYAVATKVRAVVQRALKSKLTSGYRDCRLCCLLF